MTSPSVAFSPVSRICAQVEHLGFAAARRIRLYGEEFEVVSDPFPEADGVAVHVTTKKDPSIRLLRIPMTVLQSARRAAATALAAIRVESAVVERGEKSSMNKSSDQDRGKGATEQNPQNQGEGGNTSMKGQLGHRDENAELKNAILICRGETCCPLCRFRCGIHAGGKTQALACVTLVRRSCRMRGLDLKL